MKGLWNSRSIIHITISFLFLFTYNLTAVFAAPARHLCHPVQRDALLKFKNEFEINKPCSDGPRPKTESWTVHSDCCSWDGITCDTKSWEVIELDLSRSCLHGQLHSNSSLFKVKNLITLDLSYNYFSGHISSSIGNFSHLTTLDLSKNYFSGWIPSSIGNLSHLTILDLSGNDFIGELPSLDRMNQLNLLNIEFNKFSGSFPHSLLNLGMLSDLYLSHNHFTGTLPSNMSSLYNLEYFEAWDNSFSGTLSSSLFTIPSLTYVDLRDNQLNGTLELANISSPSKLISLNLGNNNFIGPVPKSISKLVNLQDLDLSRLNTQGPVDFSIFSNLKSLQLLDLSHLNTTTTIDLNAILHSHLQSIYLLDLSGNHVSTTNNKSSGANPHLQMISQLHLSGCGVTEFPELLRTQRNLTNLDISNNNIKGHVPGWLWTLPTLKYVDLSNNKFIGFGLSSFSRPSMQYLVGSNNNFTGEIPSFICDMRSLITLDLSSNNLNGAIPRCMGNLKSNLSFLNLRKNRLSGDLPNSLTFGSLRSLDVGHNQLTGKLPRSLARFSTLEVLNVEGNRIKDTFPVWLSSLKHLQVLVLSSNEFHGPIHQASFPTLRIIDISDNHFNGTLPSNYFVNWSAMSSLNEDRSKEKYMGDFLSYYHDSVVLMNKGIEMELVRILKIYTTLDFSRNKLEGEIPRSIGALKELHVLNLSHNAFTHHIPSSMGNLTALESLDVSQNKLSGEIPQELGNLSYLAYMNFSHNGLVGLVPGGTQFRRQKCSSFEENSGLFGPALDEVCKGIHTPEPQEHEKTEQEEEKEEVLSWVAAAIGFGPGLVFGLVIGYVLISYKPEWFTNSFGRNERRSFSKKSRLVTQAG